MVTDVVFTGPPSLRGICSMLLQFPVKVLCVSKESPKSESCSRISIGLADDKELDSPSKARFTSMSKCAPQPRFDPKIYRNRCTARRLPRIVSTTMDRRAGADTALGANIIKLILPYLASLRPVLFSSLRSRYLLISISFNLLVPHARSIFKLLTLQLQYPCLTSSSSDPLSAESDHTESASASAEGAAVLKHTVYHRTPSFFNDNFCDCNSSYPVLPVYRVVYNDFAFPCQTTRYSNRYLRVI
ncbi:hypothetical protein BS17DRAFT_816138 [Gyrodon lividus]|nr:hypothetical protein BS17DRAFT_816138 [Gyrodon lividus]